MAPSSVVAPPPETTETRDQKPASTGEGSPARAVAEAPVPVLATSRRHELLEESLFDLSPTRPRHWTLDFFASVFMHALVLGILLLLPLYFTEAIDLKQFAQTLLVAPPPPPPPPPPAPQAIAKMAVAPRRVFTSGGKLVAPVAIPEKVAMLKEEALPPEVGLGAVGGIPGGVPGGQLGGVIGGIISGAGRSYIPPAPKAAAPQAPIRVGGRVKAPRPLATPEPVYPTLAKQAKVEGDVVIDAVIDTAGNVVEMQAVSGHPLLIPAAMDALRKWKYEPTYLNEQPVPVQLLVTIKFRLN